MQGVPRGWSLFGGVSVELYLRENVGVKVGVESADLQKACNEGSFSGKSSPIINNSGRKW